VRAKFRLLWQIILHTLVHAASIKLFMDVYSCRREKLLSVRVWVGLRAECKGRTLWQTLVTQYKPITGCVRLMWRPFCMLPLISYNNILLLLSHSLSRQLLLLSLTTVAVSSCVLVPCAWLNYWLINYCWRVCVVRSTIRPFDPLQNRFIDAVTLTSTSQSQSQSSLSACGALSLFVLLPPINAQL